MAKIFYLVLLGLKGKGLMQKKKKRKMTGEVKLSSRALFTKLAASQRCN